jgi:type IV fimbrial biogenesis protein FimT
MTLIYKNQMNPFADHRKAINERGFTLIELMVAIAILAILLGVGIPSFANIIIATRVKNAGIDLHTSLMAARSAAITRNTTVTITPQGAAGARVGTSPM